MKLTDNGGDLEQPEAGSYAATCFKIIDLGTQAGEYQGKPIHRRQMVVGWEIDEKMTDGRPFIMTRFYTSSLNEKANLRKDLDAWRGVPFTEVELGGFDPKCMMGKSCLLSLTRNEKGKVRVSSVSKLPKGMNAPALAEPTVYFSLDEYDQKVFDGLSEWFKKTIVQSPEYQAIQSKKADDVPF
jgi:hypothetical protein